MALVKWMKGIDYVSGLLSSRPKAGTPHSGHQSALLATHRKAETTNPDCTRIYAVGAYNRSTVPGADELARRLLFKNRQQWVVDRSQNMSTLTQDQANYLAQKDEPNGAKTWKKYLWKLAKAAVTGTGN